MAKEQRRRDVPPETQVRRTDEQWLALWPAGRKDKGMPPKNSSSSTSPVGSVRLLAVKFLATIGDYLEQVAGWCCLLLKEKREKKK